jgi:energy-coupling factor transporter ATP-binding protein EcfA2
MQIGTTIVDNQRLEFPTAARRRHLLIVGQTGTGKSTLLKNMIAQDLDSGFAYFDPHGQEADDILDIIPAHRARDVIYIDPSDHEHPVAWSLFPTIPSGLRGAFAKMQTAIFKHVWRFRSEAAPRMERYMLNGIRTLLDIPQSDLLDLLLLFSDADFRKEKIKLAEDPLNKLFWQKFEQQKPEQIAATSDSLLTRLDKFLFAPSIRHMVCQPESSIDLRKIMDDRQILIVNLSKGAISEDDASLIGAFLFNGLLGAAFSRVDILEEERRDFYGYFDEFQNYSTPSMRQGLSEARKYRLNLTFASQYVRQIDDEVRDAVFGNVGSLISLGVGPDDTELLARHLGLQNPDVLRDLPDYRAYARIGRGGDATKIILDPPPEPPRKPIRESIKTNSQHKRGRKAPDIAKRLEPILHVRPRKTKWS